MNTVLFAVIALILGASVGFFLKKSRLDQEIASIESEKEKAHRVAEEKSREILFEAKSEALKIQEEAKREERNKRQEINSLEKRLLDKERSLDNKIENLDRERENLDKKNEEARKLKEEAVRIQDQQKAKLEEVAALSKEQAREILLKTVESEAKEDIIATIKRAEKEVKEEAERKGRFLIAEAISRYAAETTMESTITTITIPSDDMKGRIIGREGRNIHTLEQATGVDVIVDDTPGSISISCFDLLRRYIAKASLEKLVADGRIHPARIEEVVQKTKEEVNVLIRELGEKAMFEAGVGGLHPDLIKLLGRLKFRVMNGQNVLKHSMEVSFIAAELAAEVGANVEICRKAGLLQAVGKAVDHEIDGHHSLIARDLLKKYGIAETVIHCVESCYDKVEAESLEAKLVQAARLIAEARPGANKENMDSFIKRLTELENVALSFNGVKKCYAIQAGRQLRVIVDPEIIDDLAAVKLARDLTKKIEKDLKYPGQIRVDVMRETRAEAFAS